MTRHRFGLLKHRLPASPRGAGQGASARWWAQLALAWLVLALVAAPSLGRLHQVVHGDALDRVQASAHAHRHTKATAGAEHSHGLIAQLVAGHAPADCLLLDQLALGDALHSAPWRCPRPRPRRRSRIPRRAHHAPAHRAVPGARPASGLSPPASACRLWRRPSRCGSGHAAQASWHSKTPDFIARSAIPTRAEGYFYSHFHARKAGSCSSVRLRTPGPPGGAQRMPVLQALTTMTSISFAHPVMPQRRRPTTLHPVALAAMLALSGAGPIAQAQTTAPAAAEAAPSLPPVTVSASGLQLGASDMTTPATVLEGDELVRRREATLGETLNSEPGITSSHFGAGASRPIIRGMDGPRVKVLSDGAELHDASTISPDHAVVSEPMLATQIEVLRGPSALIYGNGAVGGVVNVLDGKVPTAVPAKGLEGSAELRANTGAREGAGAFSLTGGTGNLAVHVEGVARDAGDYRVGKGWAPEGEATRKVLGSFNRTNTGSVGLSWVGDRGYLGAAYTRQTAKYGLPGHNHSFEGCHTHGNQLHCGAHEGEGEDGHDHDHGAGHGDVPVVDLRSERFDIRGELRNPFAGFSALRVRAGVTDYVHDEVEDGAVSTTFKNKAYDTRIELQHEPIAGFKGVIGLQTSQRKFSAEGEEAYVQPTVTRRTSLFALEEYRLGDWRFEAALRHDRQTARAETSGIERSHNGTSASLGAVWKFTPATSWAPPSPAPAVPPRPKNCTHAACTWPPARTSAATPACVLKPRRTSTSA